MSSWNLVKIVESQDNLPGNGVGGYGLLWLDVRMSAELDATYHLSRPVGLWPSDFEAIKTATADAGADLVITADEYVYMTAFIADDASIEQCDELAFVIATAINEVARLTEFVTLTRVSVEALV